tara:strand:+ start:3628 stop:3777 length:150 start_codon:yes stop_codon:yes gene_type:complete
MKKSTVAAPFFGALISVISSTLSSNIHQTTDKTTQLPTGVISADRVSPH